MIMNSDQTCLRNIKTHFCFVIANRLNVFSSLNVFKQYLTTEGVAAIEISVNKKNQSKVRNFLIRHN